MLQVVIKEPQIEQYFNNSENEILKALDFIVQNNIQEYKTIKNGSLTQEQKQKLQDRIDSFASNRDIGTSWDSIKDSFR